LSVDEAAIRQRKHMIDVIGSFILVIGGSCGVEMAEQSGTVYEELLQINKLPRSPSPRTSLELVEGPGGEIVGVMCPGNG
jgi:hypothetical protein